MKKINIKFVSIALFLLTLLAGGFAAKQAIAPAGGGWAPDPNPDGG
jgi:hypothetical protein